MISEKKFKKTIDELSEESCKCHGGFCLWKKIIEHQHTDLRTLIQIQAIYKFAFEESVRSNKDISENASLKWFESGLAKRFAEVYDDELSFKEIYKLTMEKYNVEKGMVIFE